MFRVLGFGFRVYSLGCRESLRYSILEFPETRGHFGGSSFHKGHSMVVS